MGQFARPAIVALMVLACIASFAQGIGKKRSLKQRYDEIHFEDLIQRYLEKENHALSAIEGVYSVSCVVVKKGPHIITRQVQEKVVARKENYARVAVLRDRPGSKRDFIEVSLSYREADKYPVMGEFNLLSEGGGLIYQHFEPDGAVMAFSMTHESDLIEGEYSRMEGNKTITYKLSYLRIYPKNLGISVRAEE